jgi:hypothetical protein
MRTLLLATALAAVAAVPSAPANAVGTPGAAFLPLAATDFFRPNVGVVALGSCSYAGAVLAAEGASISVLPGSEISVEVSCDLYDAYGRNVGHVSGPPQRYVTAGAIVVLPVNTPVTLCGSITGTASNWGPAYNSGCTAVVPGNLA